MKKTLIFIIRVITGLVFVFSGTVKGIDPMGTEIKFSDYFTAFKLEFLEPLSLTFTLILCLAEFIAGFALLTGIRYKEGLWGIFLLMCFFTPLSLILALTNPVSDCGCFGDAVKLTNWQTFWKNVVLITFVILLIISKIRPPEYIKPATGWIILAASSLLFVGFCFYNLRYLPVIDFRPYKEGNNIKELMEIPEDAPKPVFKSTFIYEKNGVRKEFTLDNYPADDTSWVFVDQISVMVKKGYEPPITDFSIYTTDNNDITDIILDNLGYTLLMISPKLEKADLKRLNKGFATGYRCLDTGIDFYIVTASGSDKIKEYENGLKFCIADETVLQTMVRANPGYIMLKNGTIICKWSWANLPSDIEKLKSIK